jgi:hypothetical protein
MRENHPTPVTYSPADARQIREELGTGDQTANCPLCSGELSVRGPIEGTGSLGPVWRVDCISCHRTAFITEVPHTREPDSPGG